MKHYATLIFALLMLAQPAFAASAKPVGADKAFTPDQRQFVTIMPNVVVEDGVIRLGDLFQGAGDDAGRVVAYAPRPGARAVFDARWLQRVAAAFQLSWQPATQAETVVVERASQIITQADVESLLLQRLAEDGADANVRAVLSNRAFVLHLPLGASAALAVEQMTIDPSSGRFTALLAWGRQTDESVRLSGRVERMTQVPMLSNRIMGGQVIREADLQWVDMPDGRLPRGAITDATMIVGMSAKRPLQPGKPITEGDIRRPLLVNKGESVTMILSTPLMQLTAKGKALESGSEGDTIRITNSQSNTVVDAVVTGAAQARVDTTVDLAMR